MLTTYCRNEECSEYEIAKEVPADLADAAIHCGACGNPTTEPTQMADAKKGQKI